MNEKRLNKTLNILFYTIFFVVTLVYTKRTYNNFEFVKEIMLAMLGSIALMLLAFKKTIKIGREGILALSFIVVLLISNIFITADPLIKNSFHYFKEANYLLVLAAMLLFFYNSRPNKFKFAALVLLLAAATVAVGILQYYGNLTHWTGKMDIFNKAHTAIIAKATYQGHWPSSTPISTLGNENFFSEFLAIAFIFMAYLFAKAKKTRVIIIVIAVPALFLFFNVFTRASVLALLVTALLWLLSKLKPRTRKIAVAVLIVLTSIFAFYAFKSDTLRTDSNIRNRFLMYKIGMSMALTNGLTGIGFGKYKYVYPKQQGQYFLKTDEYKSFNFGRAEHTHDELIQSLVENGILYSAVFILFFVAFFKKARVQDIGFFIISAMLINSFFAFPFHMLPQALFVLYFLFAHDSQKTVAPHIGIRAALIILALFIIFYNGKRYVAAVNFKKGTIYSKIMQANKVNKAIIAQNGIYSFEHALKILPNGFYSNNIRYNYMLFLKQINPYSKRLFSVGYKAYSLNPYIIATTFEYARVCNKLNLYNRAEEALQMANLVNPREPTVYDLWYRVRTAAKRNGEEILKLQQIYVGGSDKTKIEALLVAKDVAGIKKLLQKEQNLDKFKTFAPKIAQLFLANKDYSNALKWYQKAISGQPKILQNYVNVVNIYIAQRKLNKAISTLKQMKKQTSDPKVLKEIDDNIQKLGTVLPLPTF